MPVESMPSDHDPDPLLERRVHEALRSLPPRRAPEGLAQRVLETLAQRAAQGTALPWWRRQVTHWPIGARLLFALVAAALILVSLAGSARLRRLTAPVAPALSWSHHAAALWNSVHALLAAVLNALPMQWLEVAAVLAIGTYLFLFGVGAAAYRLLYLER
jgi:hypothetical protein